MTSREAVAVNAILETILVRKSAILADAKTEETAHRAIHNHAVVLADGAKNSIHSGIDGAEFTRRWNQKTK